MYLLLLNSTATKIHNSLQPEGPGLRNKSQLRIGELVKKYAEQVLLVPNSSNW